MPIGTTNYPASLDTDESLIQVKDKAFGALSANIDAAVTTIPMDGTAALSSTGAVTIQGEHVTYTSKNSTNLLGCTRGQFITLGGSAPASHVSGTLVEQLIIAATHDVLVQAIKAQQAKIGIGADTPGATNEFLVATGAGASGWRALISGDITGALGFTPIGIAGGTFTGAVGIDDGAGAVASAGSLRLVSGGTVVSRNNADSGNVTLLGKDASDNLVLRGGAASLTGAGAFTVGSISATTTIAAGGAVTGVSFAAGTDPAASGGFRLPNASWIAARNSGNTADINLIRAAASGAVEVGPATGISISAAGVVSMASDLAVTEGGTGASDASGARSNLGLVIGTNVQAWDTTLDSWAAIAPPSGAVVGTTDTQTLTNKTLTTPTISSTGFTNAQHTHVGATSGGQLTDAALSAAVGIAKGGTGATTAAAARAALDVEPGVDVQAFDPELNAIAGLTSVADRVPYFTGSGTAALATFTAGGRAVVGLTAAADRFPYWTSASAAALGTITTFGRSLVDDADATAGRSTLGLGTIATQAASSVAITGGSITGITDLAIADGGTGASTAATARSNLGVGPGLESLTLSNGAITIAGPETTLVVVDTEGGAASDDLHTINGGTNGQRLVVMTASSSRDVTVTETGNLEVGTLSISLTTTTAVLDLVHRSGTWYRVSNEAN